MCLMYCVELTQQIHLLLNTIKLLKYIHRALIVKDQLNNILPQVIQFQDGPLYHKLQHVFKVRMNLDSHLIKQFDVQ